MLKLKPGDKVIIASALNNRFGKPTLFCQVLELTIVACESESFRPHVIVGTKEFEELNKQNISDITAAEINKSTTNYVVIEVLRKETTMTKWLSTLHNKLAFPILSLLT